MKEYQVEIKETLTMTVTIEAESAAQAQEIVGKCWVNNMFVLDTSNIQSVDFTILPKSDYDW